MTNAVLTQEEIRSIEHGIDITILLTVTDAADSISAKDKTIMEKALDHYSIGQYLDISLLKIIDGEQSRLTKTSGSIKITIDIPDSLKNKENTVNREFVILRMHDGLAVILNDLDTDANTITIETDRFPIMRLHIVIYLLRGTSLQIRQPIPIQTTIKILIKHRNI